MILSALKEDSMSYAETNTTAGALSAGQKIRVVASRTGFVRVYDPTLGATTSAASANLPAVASVLVHTAHDDAAPWYSEGVTPGAGQNGMVEVFLTVPAADVVNAPSVQTFKVPAGTFVTVATG